MNRDFSGKTVVITGACRGIGAGIAARFAQDGANLVMVSNSERVFCYGGRAWAHRQRDSGPAGGCNR
ncbi:SDR family NAD(P)-dependent oxidoreductase [Pantoea ananatis]